MTPKLLGLAFGAGFGFVMAWAGLSDPTVIREMLLLEHPDVFLLMGSAVCVVALGVRLLHRAGVRSLIGGEPVAWTLERAERRHVAGSMLFGAGWSVAGTCPGPAAAMIGEGSLAGVFVALGLLGGALLQGALRSQGREPRLVVAEAPGVVGL